MAGFEKSESAVLLLLQFYTPK